MILVTGVTGFIGGALAARLENDAARIVALVRAGSREEGRARLEQSLSRFDGAERASVAVGRMEVVTGDLSSESTYGDSLFDRVTHVVHAAACTSFGSTRDVWRSNVLGTALLAKRMAEAPRLERFLYVSTAYCCGDRPGTAVFEDDSPRAEHSYVNAYSRSKADCERALFSRECGLPVIVARPSVVIGHSTLGVAPSSSLYWYYRALAMLGAGPFELQSRRDIVPADYVADALAFLLKLERPRHRVYHVSAGAEAAVSIEEILKGLAGEAGWKRATPAELSELTERILPHVRTPAEARQVLFGVAATAKFGALGVDYFDNSRLLAEGFRAPPRFTDYLSKCVSSSAQTVFEQMVDEH
jgi:nucleoside-diphosphate-sugar epimerase